jgi:hypothetical protein
MPPRLRLSTLSLPAFAKNSPTQHTGRRRPTISLPFNPSMRRAKDRRYG